MIKPSNMEEREEAVRLYLAMEKAQDARDEAPTELPDAEFRVLDDAAYAAEQAYENHPLTLLFCDEAEMIPRCAASKAPLLVTDEILEDSETNELFLRSALGLPPREKEEVGEITDKMMADIVA